MRVEDVLLIGSGRLPAHRTLIAGLKSLEDGGGRTPIDAYSVNVRRSGVARCQERKMVSLVRFGLCNLVC